MEMPFWRAWTASQFLSSVGVAVASADAGKKGNGKRSRLNLPVLKAMSKPFWIPPVQYSSLSILISAQWIGETSDKP